MIGKAMILGLFLASTPVVIATYGDDAPQDPTRSGRVDTIDEIDRLRERLDAAVDRADAAERQAEALEERLEEALDHLQNQVLGGTEGERRRRHNDCTPSRSLLTHYQWMQERDNDERAAEALDLFIRSVGNSRDRLNRHAWSLMTDAETSGQFDRAALALAERLDQSRDELDHRQLDTVALAKFLNGKLTEAIEVQKLALTSGGDRDEYRRRLRTYEAAQSAVEASKPTPTRDMVRPVSDGLVGPIASVR